MPKKKLGLLFQFTQYAKVWQYEININVAPQNETDTDELNKDVVTVETNKPKFPQLRAISVNLKNLIHS